MSPVLSVVLPAYNEEATIELVILDHVRVLTESEMIVPAWEIVCLDDASTDHTWRILQRLRSNCSQLRVIRHEQNRGICASFSHLYQEAQGTLIYSTGSDGQWPAENLQLMLRRLRAGADLVVGVRTNRRQVYGFRRHLLSVGFNLLARLVFGVATNDAGSVKLGDHQLFSLELISHSPFSEAERIIKAHRAGYRVAFVPIEFRRRPAGKASGASWKNILGSTRDLIRCVRAYGIR